MHRRNRAARDGAPAASTRIRAIGSGRKRANGASGKKRSKRANHANHAKIAAIARGRRFARRDLGVRASHGASRPSRGRVHPKEIAATTTEPQAAIGRRDRGRLPRISGLRGRADQAGHANRGVPGHRRAANARPSTRKVRAGRASRGDARRLIGPADFAREKIGRRARVSALHRIALVNSGRATIAVASTGRGRVKTARRARATSATIAVRVHATSATLAARVHATTATSRRATIDRAPISRHARLVAGARSNRKAHAERNSLAPRA